MILDQARKVLVLNWSSTGSEITYYDKGIRLKFSPRRKIEIFEDFQTEIFGFKMCLYKFMHCTDA